MAGSRPRAKSEDQEGTEPASLTNKLLIQASLQKTTTRLSAFSWEEAKVQLSSVILNLATSAMLPKFYPNEIKVIYLRCTGGEVGAMSVLAPKIGPPGLFPKKVGDDIAKATSD
ncbi:hypothetical protein H8959_007993 [Pygathrix nigripes]